MPSACTKPDNKASNEALNQIEKCVVVVEKKVRNLEKRKGKLDAYRAKKDGGEKLNEDQEDAISKYEAVIQNLEFARDLQKHFQGMIGDVEKMAKKKVKREKVERQEQEAARMRELLKLQDLLSNMGLDEVREDFKTGSNGAIQLSSENLDQLDEIYKLITPSRDGDVSYAEQMIHAPDHIVSFLDAREKEFAGTTYKDVKELVDKIVGCGYFDNLSSRLEAAAAETGAEVAEPEETTIADRLTHEEVPVQNIKQTPSQPEPQVMQPIDPVVPMPEQEEITVAPVMPTPVLNGPPMMPEADVAYEDDSFFSTAQYQAQPREFKEIVDSVQGNFNFLQDSELDVESAHRMDPAVVAARPMAKGMNRSHVPEASMMPAGYQGSSLMSSDEQTASAAATFSQQIAAQPTEMAVHHAASQPVAQSQHITTDSLDFGAASTPSMGESIQQSTASQLQFGAVDSLVSVHDSQTQSLASGSQSLEAAYSQTLMSQSLGGSTSSQHVSSFGDQSASAMMPSHMGLQDPSVEGLGSAASNTGPQPIPLPSQTLPGQSLMGQTFSEADSSAASQEKKPYTMNPNADPFKSTTMFGNSPSISAPLQATSSGSSQGAATSLVEEPRKNAWNTIPQQRPQPVDEQDAQSDFPTYNNSQYQRNSGPPRGGRGGFSRGGAGRGTSNGYTRGGGGGNRGGSTMYTSNRGDGNSSRGFSNRGGRGGNAWQGYPARSDYRPEGGYQGYSNTFSTSGANGGMRGGPSRGGSGGSGGSRGGRGTGASYGRPSSSPYSQ